MRLDGLTPKQVLFLNRYLTEYNRNATLAYQSVYVKSKSGSARANASKLLAKPTAQAYISEFIAALPPSKTVTVDYVIAGIKKEAETAQRAADRLMALQLIGRYLKMFKDIEVNTAVLTTDDYANIRLALKNVQSGPVPALTEGSNHA